MSLAGQVLWNLKVTASWARATLGMASAAAPAAAAVAPDFRNERREEPSAAFLNFVMSVFSRFLQCWQDTEYRRSVIIGRLVVSWTASPAITPQAQGWFK